MVTILMLILAFSITLLSFISWFYLSRISNLLQEGIVQAQNIADEQKNKIEPPPPVSLGDTELHTQTEILAELQRQGKAIPFD